MCRTSETMAGAANSFWTTIRSKKDATNLSSRQVNFVHGWDLALTSRPKDVNMAQSTVTFLMHR